MKSDSAKIIYLDYAATTPVDPRVIKKMLKYLGPNDCFANPSSAHIYGREAALAVKKAREQLADLLDIEANTIVWTSGATESIHLALRGSAQAYSDKGRHIITCATEHLAVLETCHQLEREGFVVTYLQPNSAGLLTLEHVEKNIRPDTILLSIAHVNNEIGVIQDIASLGRFAKTKGILFHVDAAQSLGKLPLPLSHLPVDLMSFSGHKLYAPKGIGALYIKPNIRVYAQLHGGGQEWGLRSGTLPTHQIVAMGEACYLAQQTMESEQARLRTLSDYLLSELYALGQVYLNGSDVLRLSSIMNIRFEGNAGNALQPVLPGLAVSSGAACQSLNRNVASHVLKSLGLDRRQILSSLRISIGRFTTEAQLRFALIQIRSAVTLLRSL